MDSESEVRWDSRCLLNRATKAGPVAAAPFRQCASWAPSWGSFLAADAKHAGCPGGTELPSRRQTAKFCRPGGTVLVAGRAGTSAADRWLPAPTSRTRSGLAPLERRVSEGETLVVRGPRRKACVGGGGRWPRG